MSLFLVTLLIIAISSITVLGSMYAKKYNRPDLLIGLYVTFILLSQLLAVKIAVFNFFGYVFFVPAAVLVFSVTFLLTDIVNEEFGRKETHRMIFIAFLSQIVTVFFLWIGSIVDSAPFWQLQDAWDSVYTMVPRITLASWIAFMFSENLDAYIFAFFKRYTKGKKLWARSAISSLPSLAIDSIIFVPIAFWGVMPIGQIIVGQIIIKWFIGLLNIPFMYLNKYILDK